MARVASPGGDGTRGVVAEAVGPSTTGTDLIPADTAARTAVARILGIDSAVLRDDTPLSSIGWCDEAWLCLADDLAISDDDVQGIETFGALVQLFGVRRGP